MIIIPSILALSITSAPTSIPLSSQSPTREPIAIDPAADIQFVGPQDQPILILPLQTPQWAKDLGIIKTRRLYKGICADHGAVINPQDLLDAAEADLLHSTTNRNAPTTETVGQAPAFNITYDDSNTLLTTQILPSVRDAALYIDSQLDNRANIGITLKTRTFDGNILGNASSDEFLIPWSAYVRGLRSHASRKDTQFADNLPDNILAVLYNNSTNPTNETSIFVTEAQLRAIFGDNAVPQGEAITVSLNQNINWATDACNNAPSFNQTSLIDVIVHEFTHGLGFTSQIRTGGSNREDQISALEVGRFRANNLPGPTNAFTTNPRIGERFTNETHHYANPFKSFFTELESGDNHQPTHLSFRRSNALKLGMMDPEINAGHSRCPDFYSQADLQPLEDMGWTLSAHNASNDCNNNGTPDAQDIANGTSLDRDNDSIPDECETFTPPTLTSTPNSEPGLTKTTWITPGLFDLADFDPTNPKYTSTTTTVSTPTVEEVFDVFGIRVFELSGYIHIPQTDEYAFRFSYGREMTFSLNDTLIASPSDSASLADPSTGTIRVAPQYFVQLEQGWHKLDLQYRTTSFVGQFDMQWEARNLGAWSAIPPENLMTPSTKPDQCSPADLNHDNTLNFFDVSMFLSAFGDQDPAADFNNDASFNFLDVSAFLSTFSQGCP